MAANKKNLKGQQSSHEAQSSMAKTLPDHVLDFLKTSFSRFDTLSASKRIELYGDKEYLEQFWEHFKQQYPNLLGMIDQKDLPVYIQMIQNYGFTLSTLQKKASPLHNEFKESDSELIVMQTTLKKLKTFCDDSLNGVPVDTFKKFAREVGFDDRNFSIDSDGQLKTIDTLLLAWKKFLDKEKIVLGDAAKQSAEILLTPQYAPIERFLLTSAITKIKRELKGKLKTAFDVAFPLPLDAFSAIQDLLQFRTAWMDFLSLHSADIDESLRKKLDSIIVTNGDIYQQLSASGIDFDDTKGFSEWEKYFRRVFNKLATRQLFDEMHKTQETVDYYVDTLSSTFKKFPPYVNEIFTIYPFNYQKIRSVDAAFDTDMQGADQKIMALQEQYARASEAERKTIALQLRGLKEDKEARKRQGYIAYLSKQNPQLAHVMTSLVQNKFNFAGLSTAEQQLLVTALVEHRIQDAITRKVPELLSLSENALSQFVHDLFDLQKKEVTIPTRQGPLVIPFVKKEFLSTVHTRLPRIEDLENIQNLPLNFAAKVTDNAVSFFEESPIFASLYATFDSARGPVRIADAYKVQLTKDGKTVSGYLSSYAPIAERNDENLDGKELYLYSEPVSSPHQERTLVTWPSESKKQIPVVIKSSEEPLYDIKILDKQLNLNGEALGALLFGYTLSQHSMLQTLSPAQERKLADKIGKLDVYQDIADNDLEEEKLPQEVQVADKKEASPEKTPYEELLSAWAKIKGATFTDPQYKENFGFVEGSRLFIKFASSEVPPVSQGEAWMQMEITQINVAKGTFTVKINGGELALGSYEGVKKELPLTPKSLDVIKSSFGDAMYKMPPARGVSFDQQLSAVTAAGLGGDMNKLFGNLNFSGSAFTYGAGPLMGKEVTHFGLYTPKAVGEAVDAETGNLILYSIKPTSKGTITVSGADVAGNVAKNFPSRDMDYPSFMLFIKEKGLQPKAKDQLQDIYQQVKENREIPTTLRGFSINNIKSFFKTTGGKIKDAMKKYDDERAEELTDRLTDQGLLRTRLGGMLSPFGRVSSSFEQMGMDAFLERDGRVRKKVEKWMKYYEDYDYTRLYFMYIKPMLDGKMQIVPHYKLAALLLVHIKKGKGPYAKDPASATTGARVGALFGKGHQQRYLAMREKKIRELEQGAGVHGGPWADQLKNELVELEMRYLVHVMDGRHMGAGDDEKYYFQGKYSKKFCDELEGAYTGFFNQDGVNEGFNKNQGASFEFATVEYFRQLNDRPQQALPFLKVMATKAINDKQWQVFESAVLAGMLSGVFLNMTYAPTQSFIQKICRTRGFIPGLFAKDIQQQSKMQEILDIFSNGEFSKATGYSSNKYSFRTMSDSKKFIEVFQSWLDQGSRRTDLSNFLQFTGKNYNNKTLLDLSFDESLPLADKLLIKEYIEKSNDKNEGLDPNVSQNTSSLTGSILTKSQSVVEKMTRFNKTGFAGADGDEIQNMQAFCVNMQKAIPSSPQSAESVKFFLDKFFNRFGEKGFTGNGKIKLLKRLKWCSQHAKSAEVDDIMYYSTVGEILSSMAAYDSNPPQEFLDALNAWKKFFEVNLSTIISSDVIVSSFGGPQYQELFAASEPSLESWDIASTLLDPENNRLYTNTLPKEQKTQIAMKTSRLKNAKTNYLNNDLYKLASELYKKCPSTCPNLFQRDLDSLTHTTESSTKATGVKITNSSTIEDVRKILEGKQLTDDDVSVDDFTYTDEYPYSV